MNKNKRYLIVQGELVLDTEISTDNIDEARKILEELNRELTAEDFDNCNEYWILDTETDCSV